MCRVVFQWPSDGTNSLVTSRLLLQSRHVLLHRPSRSAQAGGCPAPRAAVPGKKAPVPGTRLGHLPRTLKGMGSSSQGEGGISHHHSPRTLPSGSGSSSPIHSLTHPFPQHLYPHTVLGYTGEEERQGCLVVKEKR